MSISIGDLLQKRLEAYAHSKPEEVLKRENAEYQKRWARGVQFFVDAINKDRKGTGYPPVPFIVVRQKLVALKEIDDLRWFYFHCQKYAKTKDAEGNWNTFSKCFWGALKR